MPKGVVISGRPKLKAIWKGKLNNNDASIETFNLKVLKVCSLNTVQPALQSLKLIELFDYANKL